LPFKFCPGVPVVTATSHTAYRSQEICWNSSCALLSAEVLRKYTGMFCVFHVPEGIKCET